MEKDQVTVAIQARGLTGELGTHVCSVYVTANGVERELVILQHDLGIDREVRRIRIGSGALSAHEADVAALELGDVLYNYVLRYMGVQPMLPVPRE